MTKLTQNSDQSRKCIACGADVPADARFCEQCGQVVSSESPPAIPPEQGSDAPPRQWEVNISTLKNPLLWFQLMMVSLISSSYLLLLLVGLNLFERHWEEIPASLGVGLTMAGGLFAVLSLIMILMYWRGVPTTYVLQDGYIEQHTPFRGKKTALLLSLLGILSGKNAGYTAAGATLLAQSREQIAVNWRDTTSLEVFPKRHEIQLHNEWRTIMQIICPEENFDSVLRFIRKKTKINENQEDLKNNRETPFAKKVILSIFALIFGVFLFPRLPVHYVGIFAIATIIFAFLVLWSSGLKQRIFAGILVLLPMLGVALAFVYGEVDMSRQGAIYALSIELLVLGYFTLLGLAVALKYIR